MSPTSSSTTDAELFQPFHQLLGLPRGEILKVQALGVERRHPLAVELVRIARLACLLARA
jgi:hypothetical protein